MTGQAKQSQPAGGPTAAKSSRRPLIGITTSEVRPLTAPFPTPHSDPSRPEMALGMTYIRAVEINGGIPVVIPPMAADAADDLLRGLDGLMLSGGPDLDPSLYRDAAHPALGPTWRVLDELEVALARCADRVGLPLLGFCRGAQTLNVARGGSLHQHLPDQVSSEVEHRQVAAGEVVTHPIMIEPDTVLAGMLGRDSIEVNSFHHQAIDRLGSGLRVGARAPDGVVEAIEDPGPNFFVGVQWHAEYLADREPERALLRSFLAAAAT